MHMPPLQGTFDQTDFLIYAACDRVYFSEFGPAFINSIKYNTPYHIHIHLFNPTVDQIDFCQRRGVGVTWEHVHQTLFLPSAQRWQTQPTSEPERTHYDRTMNAMKKGGDSTVLDRMQKTYYACARFIRLSQFSRTQAVLAIDIDAVVRKPVAVLDSQRDFYLHHISGKKARYLAGGLWLNVSASCQQFLNEYAAELQSFFHRDYVYWSLDQDVLDPIVPRFNHGQLPIDYIDWNMSPNSYIWTAKGTRKDLSVFVNEKQKYSVL